VELLQQLLTVVFNQLVQGLGRCIQSTMSYQLWRYSVRYDFVVLDRLGPNNDCHFQTGVLFIVHALGG
jgi:hypothetical protein